jgi:hypothetical protein
MDKILKDFVIPSLYELVSKYEKESHLKTDTIHETEKDYQNRKAIIEKK